MIRIKKNLILITLLFISACGYHLRGSIDLPESLKNVYLQGASGQLGKEFKKTLRSSDGKLVDKVDEAGIVVKVTKETMRRRVLSISSTGRANEYELYYLLNFILLDAKGNELSKTQVIEIHKDYFDNQEQVLGKNIEEQVIRTEMYRQAVNAIFNRSRVALEKVKK
ncbi:MAG: hypothetical protein KAI44_06215 [Methylococcales bacterium]|nr:hypothetical protein [Methylococcales bacterium]MCK5478491.1 hypothetical protein [Methylococcales bacterium]